MIYWNFEGTYPIFKQSHVVLFERIPPLPAIRNPMTQWHWDPGIPGIKVWKVTLGDPKNGNGIYGIYGIWFDFAILEWQSFWGHSLILISVISWYILKTKTEKHSRGSLEPNMPRVLLFRPWRLNRETLRVFCFMRRKDTHIRSYKHILYKQYDWRLNGHPHMDCHWKSWCKKHTLMKPGWN